MAFSTGGSLGASAQCLGFLPPELLVIRSAIIATFALVLVPSGCFRGAEREKQPPAGSPGGKCAAPDGRCKEAQCNREKNYCFDPGDPCLGFFCGGSDRGTCVVNAGLPSCMCDPGYESQQFELYCCPEPGFGFDELCDAEATASAGATASATASAGTEDDGESSSGPDGSTGELDTAGHDGGTDW